MAPGRISRSSFSFRPLRHIPMTSQPIGDQSNLPLCQYLFFPKGRHSIIAFAVKTRVLRIADETNEPLTRAVICQIRSAGVFIGFMELMTLGASCFRLQQCSAFLNERRIALID